LGFVDLPGFGYNKLSKETNESVEEAAKRYLGKRRKIGLGVLLVDFCCTPSVNDRVVLAALFDMGVPLIVVATKSDKLKGSKVELAMRTIWEGLGLLDGYPLRVSGVTGEGVEDLWRMILDACKTRVEDLKQAMEEGKDNGGIMRMGFEEESEDGGDFYNDFVEEGEDEQNILKMEKMLCTTKDMIGCGAKAFPMWEKEQETFMTISMMTMALWRMVILTKMIIPMKRDED